MNGRTMVGVAVVVCLAVGLGAHAEAAGGINRIPVLGVQVVDGNTIVVQTPFNPSVVVRLRGVCAKRLGTEAGAAAKSAVEEVIGRLRARGPLELQGMTEGAGQPTAMLWARAEVLTPENPPPVSSPPLIPAALEIQRAIVAAGGDETTCDDFARY